jgi:hypothetical protein
MVGDVRFLSLFLDRDISQHDHLARKKDPEAGPHKRQSVY